MTFSPENIVATLKYEQTAVFFRILSAFYYKKSV